MLLFAVIHDAPCGGLAEVRSTRLDLDGKALPGHIPVIVNAIDVGVDAEIVLAVIASENPAPLVIDYAGNGINADLSR